MLEPGVYRYTITQNSSSTYILALGVYRYTMS